MLFCISISGSSSGKTMMMMMVPFYSYSHCEHDSLEAAVSCSSKRSNAFRISTSSSGSPLTRFQFFYQEY